MSRILGKACLALSLLLPSGAAWAEMSLSSPAFEDGAPLTERHVFQGFGCEGENLSPALTWEGAPEGTKSFALMVHDPDAPTGSGWWHWVLIDLPPDLTGLPEGLGSEATLPEGAREGRTDYGAPGYGGPCPPENHGPHHYTFSLFALDVESLPVEVDKVTAALIGYMVNAHAIEKATLTGTYER